ncbi:alpha-xylosidase [Streptomyces sp. NPDC001315]|uniref:alpha-xylosidase n=1 Tax=Streptomyces sp. NPDC001315 TaxID=3364562 RepID=UPI00367EF6AF
MKFTDGQWQLRPGVTALYAAEAYDIHPGDHEITVLAPTAVISRRGDTLNRPALTVSLSSPMADVIRVRIDHHAHRIPGPHGFPLPGAGEDVGTVTSDADQSMLTSGGLTARVTSGSPWQLSFEANGRTLTTSGPKSIACFTADRDAHLDPGPADRTRHTTARPVSYLAQQLSLDVGEAVYGLGERFGPLVKNGQSIDIWNADGGTSSEQAYKSVPFYLTNRGYGVFVNDTGHVSYEVGSEAVQRVQFSVAAQRLEYFVIHGPTPKDILTRYTALTGRPAQVPAWSYGVWLSTSFTTDYDEATVTSFIDGMAERDLPLSVFHFDCFWMRAFHWCDFRWDARVFPDPAGMLARLHRKNLHTCVWINPYIAQRSELFDEAAARGFLLKREDGSVWQWDMWQAGMALVDFTHPEATEWFKSKLRVLLDQGVDAFKTDFGERIPLDVAYFDGSAPERMHNYYTHLYNKAVFEVLEEQRGRGDAVLFARSATAGGQQFPVHWGGDSASTLGSMADTLRGGLSLAYSGFAFWSHDIGGFEGTPDPGVFKRWTAFGLLSSHSRLHGSSSYRVPWAFDDEAVEVMRRFTHLKLRLMPYLYQAGITAHERGIPVMRPMAMEFPDDPATTYLDTQYMLGDSLLVAPVFKPDGTVDLYLPGGTWTNYFTGERVRGGGWRREVHDYTSLPLYVREGAVLPVGSRHDRPDYDYLDGLTLRVYPGPDSTTNVTVTSPISGTSALFTTIRAEGHIRVTSTRADGWTHQLV